MYTPLDKALMQAREEPEWMLDQALARAVPVDGHRLQRSCQAAGYVTRVGPVGPRQDGSREGGLLARLEAVLAAAEAGSGVGGGNVDGGGGGGSGGDGSSPMAPAAQE